jgi:hypothetical protein
VGIVRSLGVEPAEGEKVPSPLSFSCNSARHYSSNSRLVSVRASESDERAFSKHLVSKLGLPVSVVTPADVMAVWARLFCCSRNNELFCGIASCQNCGRIIYVLTWTPCGVQLNPGPLRPAVLADCLLEGRTAAGGSLVSAHFKKAFPFVFAKSPSEYERADSQAVLLPQDVGKPSDFISRFTVLLELADIMELQWCYNIFVLTPQAAGVLEGLLKRCGELVPLVVPDGELLVFRCLNFVDVLDWERVGSLSERGPLGLEDDPPVYRLKNGAQSEGVHPYQFRLEDVREGVIFALPGDNRLTEGSVT